VRADTYLASVFQPHPSYSRIIPPARAAAPRGMDSPRSPAGTSPRASIVADAALLSASLTPRLGGSSGGAGGVPGTPRRGPELDLTEGALLNDILARGE
jgi:hypothetical protein